jgi:hypothetical protein
MNRVRASFTFPFNADAVTPTDALERQEGPESAHTRGSAPQIPRVPAINRAMQPCDDA